MSAETKIITGDVIAALKDQPSESVQTCVTSPPYYGLRSYGIEGQIGLEESPAAYVTKLVEVFHEVHRVLRKDGTLWLNLGDSYSNSSVGPRSGGTLNKWKNGGRRNPDVGEQGIARVSGMSPKNLLGIPWRVAFALQADGWILRQEIIWAKPNAMPESVTDRCTKAHEQIFLLAKSSKYHFDHEAFKEPAKGIQSGAPTKRNRRSVWTVSTRPYKGSHFATFPPALIEPCVLAGCPREGVVLDPFGGSGTTALVANTHGRNAILIEINPAYVILAEGRLRSLAAGAPPVSRRVSHHAAAIPMRRAAAQGA